LTTSLKSVRASPNSRKNRSAHQSFRIPQRVKLEDRRVYIPKVGWVAVRQSQAIDLPLKSATFKREATGKWYVSLVVEFDLPDQPKPVIETETAVGIDVGFDRFAADSDGHVIENPRFFRKAERKIKRASRRLSRSQKGSANRAKARRALAREYEKVANRRADFGHKFSTSIVTKKNTIDTVLIVKRPSHNLGHMAVDFSTLRKRCGQVCA
jgi:putative transposase